MLRQNGGGHSRTAIKEALEVEVRKGELAVMVDGFPGLRRGDGVNLFPLRGAANFY
jgi:hypothetical protein